MNIADLISTYSQKNPYQKAVVYPVKKDRCGRWLFNHLTYQDLNSTSDVLATHLIEKHHIKKGDKVLLFIKPTLEFSTVVFALFKLGAIPVLMDPGMGRKLLIGAIKELQPQTVIGEPIVGVMLKFMFFKLGFSPKFISVRKSYFLFQDLENAFDTKHRSLNENSDRPIQKISVRDDEAAAIVFTSGGTGKPKGVILTHGNLSSHVTLIKEMLGLKEGDCDMPGFPLFSLTTIAMGVTSVIPLMNPAKPARANPQILVELIKSYGVKTVAGSPAIWGKIADYCLKENISLDHLKGVVMFGAPISKKLISQFAKLLPHGDTYTPYGATECLPVSLISGRERLALENETVLKNDPLFSGSICIGKAVAGTEVKIVASNWEKDKQSPFEKVAKEEEVGEIVVTGKQVTQAYLDNPAANKLAKHVDSEGRLWHYMGDMGFMDREKRLWFCGRKAHSFRSKNREYLSILMEQPFLAHPEVKKAALIKKRDPSESAPIPCMVLERVDGRVLSQLSSEERLKFRSELMEISKQGKNNSEISTFYLHRKFPVDGRHNIKIDRKKLETYFSLESEKHL